MDLALALAVGALCAASVYLMLARDLVRVLVGILFLGVAANLLIFVAGGVGSGVPPLVPAGATAAPPDSADPLPQALILTAIVISFGFAAFAIVLAWTANRVFGGLDTAAWAAAEPHPAGRASVAAPDMPQPPPCVDRAPALERQTA
jgi:multicomponent Na+:H+ antiporter subunit C